MASQAQASDVNLKYEAPLKMIIFSIISYFKKINASVYKLNAFHPKLKHNVNKKYIYKQKLFFASICVD